MERMQHVERNLDAIAKVQKLKEYLEDFLRSNENAEEALPFWPKKNNSPREEGRDELVVVGDGNDLDIGNNVLDVVIATLW